MQSGGTNIVSSLLTLGYSTGDGSYDLSGGSLSASIDEQIGRSGTGSFTHSGGTNDISNFLYLGRNPGGAGSYDLSVASVPETLTLALGEDADGNSGGCPRSTVRRWRCVPVAHQNWK